jgi:nucleoid-associated protein EbfC
LHRDFFRVKEVAWDVFWGAVGVKARGKMKDCVKIKTVAVAGNSPRTRRRTFGFRGIVDADSAARREVQIKMEVNALQQMLSRLRQVQEDLQQQVNSVAVEASAGGGMVTVKMNGQKQIVDVRIEPDVFASKDQEMLQDLIRAAVNEASRRVDDELASQMKNIAGTMPGMAGLKIPGLF